MRYAAYSTKTTLQNTGFWFARLLLAPARARTEVHNGVYSRSPEAELILPRHSRSLAFCDARNAELTFELKAFSSARRTIVR